jgi:hypothetical protein
VLSFFVAMDSFSAVCWRDAAAARNGALLAMVVILPIALAVAWLGLASAVLYPDRDVSAGILTTFVLEAFPVGLKGLMVIGILSAIMSVASICVITASANYARDIHQRYFKPDIAPAAMLKVGTFASLGAGFLAMLIAWKMRDIVDILQLGFTINSAALFLPTIAAIYWDRVSAGAAFWSSSTSLATVIGWRIAADAGAGGGSASIRCGLAFSSRAPCWSRRSPGWAQAGRGSHRRAAAPSSSSRKCRGRRARPLDRARAASAFGTVETVTYRGDKEALIATLSRCGRSPHGLRAFRRLSAAASAALSHHLGGRDGLGLRGRVRRRRARHWRQLRR